LGRAAVDAMVREHVIVDLSHMSGRALADTFERLDQLDPAGAVPVLATHAGCRFGGQTYNLSDETIGRIAARDGVVGLILAEHQATDGIRRSRTATLDDSLEVLWRHVDRLHEITGSHRHTAIGTDLDGFIKPTLAGLESAADLAPLEAALIERYGTADAALITSDNALRLLRAYWRGAPAA
jgi:microsomal dipeptidase-like Zn-dependent dipeptidase